MIPIRDTIVSRSPPLVVFGLIGANAVVFYGELGLPPSTVAFWLEHLALVPSRLFGGAAEGGALLGVLGLVTSQFLHGGLLHLFGNLWTLWIFGDNVEERMGAWRFVLFYLTCGVVAGLVHASFHPHSSVPTLGASGAIAGVMGAYLVLFPLARIIFLVPVLFYPLFLELPAYLYLGLWFLMQYFGGLAAASAPGGAQDIAFWAHIGGFLAGIALCVPFTRARRPRRRAFTDEHGLEGAWRPR